MTTLIQSPRQRRLLSQTSAVLVSVSLALSGAASTASGAPVPVDTVTTNAGPSASDTGPSATGPSATVPAVSGFLAAQLAAADGRFGSTYDGVFYPDFGLTADTILALSASGAGRDQATASTDILRANVEDYIGAGDERWAGATGKLLVVAAAQGVPATDFGGLDLVGRLRDTLTESGRFSDINSYDTDYSNTLGQAWGVIGLERAAGGADASAVEFLREQQCDDGGFRLYPGNAAECDSDPDATGMAVQAIVAAAGADDDDVAEGVGYLAGMMDQSGAIGGAGPTSDVNANSTGLAAAAFAAAGDSAHAGRARTYLSSLYLGCSSPESVRGAIAYNAAGIGAIEPNDQLLRSTAQAAIGFAGQSYVSVSAAGDVAGPVRLDCSPAPEPEPGPGPTGSLGILGSLGTIS